MKLIALLLFISIAASAQQDSISLSMLNFGRDGYFKTYEDFLKGNIVEGEDKGSHSVAGKYSAKFNVKGKTESLDAKQVWGFWSKTEGLIRFNHKDGIGYKLISVGDVYYYCPWFTYPKVNPDNNKVEYEGALPHEMISASLNSEMLGQEDLFYRGLKRATEAIAGNPDIYKFELCGHGAYENISERDIVKQSVGWYLGSCYQAKSNPRIWLNPTKDGTGVVYVIETVNK